MAGKVKIGITIGLVLLGIIYFLIKKESQFLKLYKENHFLSVCKKNITDNHNLKINFFLKCLKAKKYNKLEFKLRNFLIYDCSLDGLVSFETKKITYHFLLYKLQDEIRVEASFENKKSGDFTKSGVFRIKQDQEMIQIGKYKLFYKKDNNQLNSYLMDENGNIINQIFHDFSQDENKFFFSNEKDNISFQIVIRMDPLSLKE